jgi:YfiH family protein
LLSKLGVPHAFTTRIGGVSPAPFDSLNLGNPSGVKVQDQWDRVYENYARLQSAIGCPEHTRCWVHQVHGNSVIRVEKGGEFKTGQRADALVSDDPSRLMAVRTADCVPILLASDDGKAVAAIHSGWRGIIANVVGNTLKALGSLDVPAERLTAAIGPCIGKVAFEVGPEVVEAFEHAFGAEGASAVVRRNADGKGRVDLREAIKLQLVAGGVPADQIDSTDRCTAFHRDEFFSHRREKGMTGRMAAVIAPRA